MTLQLNSDEAGLLVGLAVCLMRHLQFERRTNVCSLTDFTEMNEWQMAHVAAFFDGPDIGMTYLGFHIAIFFDIVRHDIQRAASIVGEIYSG
jgi:lactam utilization protein B